MTGNAQARPSGRPRARRTRGPGGPSPRDRARRRARRGSRRRADRADPAERRRRTRPRSTSRAVSLSARRRRSPAGRRRGSRRAGSGRRSPTGPGRARRSGCSALAERLREHLARLVGQEPDLVGLEPLGERRSARRGGRPTPMITTRRSSRSRRNVVARTRSSRFCAWPTLPECMTTNRSSRPCSRAQSLSRGSRRRSRRCRPSSGSRVIRSGGAPFVDQPLAHRLADRDDAVGALEVEADRAPQQRRRATGFSSRSSSTAISGKTSWLITTSGARKRRATRERRGRRSIGGSVMQRTMSGRSTSRARASDVGRYVT